MNQPRKERPSGFPMGARPDPEKGKGVLACGCLAILLWAVFGLVVSLVGMWVSDYGFFRIGFAITAPLTLALAFMFVLLLLVLKKPNKGETL